MSAAKPNERQAITIRKMNLKFTSNRSEDWKSETQMFEKLKTRSENLNHPAKVLNFCGEFWKQLRMLIEIHFIRHQIHFLWLSQAKCEVNLMYTQLKGQHSERSSLE